MPDTPCPSVAEFEALMLGRLDDRRATDIEAHVEACGGCQKLLDQLSVETQLTAALRSGPVPAAREPVGDMVARIQDMARQFTPAGADLSASGDGGPATGDLPFDPPSHPEDLGRMGGYRILRLLGAGGMGLVYLAQDEVLYRKVAVKVLRPRLSRRTTAREGFLKEARAMAALKHDNVVTVFQVGEATGEHGPIPFLAMELLEGESLADWLRREGAIGPAWAARLGAQAALGLAAAHARGVVHRDIKPGNLWLEAPPGWADLPADKRPPLPAVARLKVLDFGLAQPPLDGEARAENTVLGTPAYMPPEQATGRDVDLRADLFSLGVVLYELIAGKRPYPRESRRDVVNYPAPPPLADLAPATPPALADLVHRLIAVAPADRPATALAVHRELLAAVGSPDDTPSFATVTVTVPAQRRSARVVSLALGTLAVGLLVGTVWLLANAFPVTDRTAEPPFDPLPGPPDDAWVRAIGELPPERRLTTVVAKFRELNPDFNGQVTRYAFTDGQITELYLLTDNVRDIRPVRALPALKSLTVVGSEPGKGQLVDLSPIRGLPLTTLNVWQNPNLVDLSPVTGMQLTLFQAGDTAVDDLVPLRGMPISVLSVNNCKIPDVSVVTSLRKLRFLRCDGCPVESFAPLLDSTISELTYSANPGRKNDLETLEKLTKLTRINQLPAQEFRQKLRSAR